MKALTLHQPFAQLMADGRKKIETRSWSTRYRGSVAIHAGKLDPFAAYPDLCREGGYEAPEQLPRGFVVAVGRLVDVVEMTPEWIALTPLSERYCGEYAPGRFGWVFEYVRPLENPVKVPGLQGLWNWSIPLRAQPA